MNILQPPGWPRPKGYSNGISARGRMIFTAGMVGWDERFVYMEQSIWTRGECCNQILLRVAVVGGGGRKGIVPPAQVVRAMGQDIVSPPLPDWVKAWIAADAQRPWPPVLPRLAPEDRGGDLPG